MPPQAAGESPDQNVLLDIIKAQAEIAKYGLDLAGVMNFVVERVNELTGASSTIIELAEGDDMVYRAATGEAYRQLGLRLSCATSLSGACVAGGEVLRCDDSELDPRVDRLACRKIGLRSMIVTPLIHGDSVVGVLKITSPEKAAFSDRHVKILELMSDLIAAAMFHAVKHETNDLFYRATHDPLTDLANRALFYDHLRQGLTAAQRHALQLGVAVLDMDGLKAINDELGHRAGDAAIKEIATRIKTITRQSDTVARLGGDEFGIVMPDIKTRADLACLIDRVCDEIRQPFVFEDLPIELGASIGTAVFPDDGDDIELLIDKADKSMYETKRQRKMLS